MGILWGSCARPVDTDPSLWTRPHRQRDMSTVIHTSGRLCTAAGGQPRPRPSPATTRNAATSPRFVHSFHRAYYYCYLMQQLSGVEVA